jgi:hypothetical protein
MMRSSPLLVSLMAGAVFFALDPVAFLAAAAFWWRLYWSAAC